MEDILASIRRILSEDERSTMSNAKAGRETSEPQILTLDSSMMVPETTAEPGAAGSPAGPQEHAGATSTVHADAAAESHTAGPVPDVVRQPPVGVGLIAPEAASAAASAMGPLLRKLNAERATPVYRGGPSLEDMVREELRPMLKQWLDSHLPGIVERLVRAEIERVVNAATQS